MEGKQLFNAFYIAIKSWEQTQAMGGILFESLKSNLEKLENVSFVESGYSKCLYDDLEYVAINWLEDLAITEKTKRKPSRHIAFQVILYDENEESMVKGWEPSIYISCIPGRETISEDSIRISDFMGNTYLDENDSRIWRWYELAEAEDEFDSWFFAVPLVKINYENDILEQIVKPAIRLFDEKSSASIFTTNSIAHHFKINGNEIVIND
jgi:hypothetical protein